MNEDEFKNVRDKLLSDREEPSESSIEKVSFEDLFGSEEKPESKAQPQTATLSPKPPEEKQPATEEERTTLNLGQIRRLISSYRYRIADAERRVQELRAKLLGLETEYKALVGEAVPPPSPPREEEPAEPVKSQTPRRPKVSSGQAQARRANASWGDAHAIDLEEAAWRILTETGKSMPLWRIASAIRRKGFSTPFTESSLGTVVKQSKRLGFTGEGHIYIK
ncbi:MAG: hypothetical protein ACYTHN_15390 [Planctomycetota bacterium]|jgi:hypothetical protein